MQKEFTPIIEKINSANSIVLLVHENPDGDAIGSMLGLFIALTGLGKDVTGFIEKKPVNCEFLLNTIGKDIKTFEEIDFNKQYDLCIALDCGDVERIGDAKALFFNAKDTACIDHHFTNDSYANANYIDSNAAATGEIILELLKTMNIKLNSEIATALYAAVSSDTGNFRHNNTTKKTFEIAGELVEYGVDITKVSYHMFSETSLNRMIFMGKLLQNVELFLDGKLAILTANQQDIDEFKLEQSELDGMVDYARYIKGVEVGLFIKPYNEIYKVSIRSNGKIDVSGIAQKFNGGGHKFAAGCKIVADSSEYAKAKLVDAFAEII